MESFLIALPAADEEVRALSRRMCHKAGKGRMKKLFLKKCENMKVMKNLPVVDYGEAYI